MLKRCHFPDAILPFSRLCLEVNRWLHVLCIIVFLLQFRRRVTPPVLIYSRLPFLSSVQNDCFPYSTCPRGPFINGVTVTDYRKENIDRELLVFNHVLQNKARDSTILVSQRVYFFMACITFYSILPMIFLCTSTATSKRSASLIRARILFYLLSTVFIHYTSLINLYLW